MGPYKLKTVGWLGDWSIEGRGHKINVPTLLVTGVKEPSQEEWQVQWFNGIPKIKWVTFANSCHVPFFEEPDRYFATVANFVRDVSLSHYQPCREPS